MSPYAYNSSNEMTSTPAATFTYDGNGNTLTKSDANGTTTYNWNFENRLASVVPPASGGTVSFKYDPFGRRIQKNSSSGATNYVYDGSNTIEDIDGTGSLLARYTQGAGIDEPLSLLRSGTAGYFEQDGLESMTSVTGASGVLLNSDTYDSFGNVTASTGSFGNRFRYTGRDSDAETGLLYYRARYYDSSTGKFLSEDPAGFAGSGTNFYPYVGNNPTNLIDPLGLCGCEEVPEMPAGVSLMENIKKAERSKWLIFAAPRLLWFYEQVRNHGPWDYKQTTTYDSAGINYLAFGNFNFGMTGAAAGIELPILLLEQDGLRVRRVPRLQNGANGMAALPTGMIPRTKRRS